MADFKRGTQKAAKASRMAEMLDDLSLIKEAELLKLDFKLDEFKEKAAKNAQLFSVWLSLTMAGVKKLAKLAIWGLNIMVIVHVFKTIDPMVGQLWLSAGKGLIPSMKTAGEISKLFLSTYWNSLCEAVTTISGEITRLTGI